jgi:O-antigen/teichoic acid export membrane protein
MTRRAIKTSSFVMMPMMAGLAACATPLVRLLLKEQWLPCVPFMQIFCAIYAFYPLHTANLNAIKAMGRSDIFLKLEVIKKIVETSVLLYTLRYGVLAMALGQLFCDILAQLINAWPNKKLLGYPYWIQLKDLLPCLLLSLVMAGLVAAVQLLGLHDLVTLLIQVPLGVLVYTLGARLLKLDSFDYILNMAKSILQKRRAGENR